MKPKIKLEQYIDFHENPQKQDPTINHLNQIICMHGFMKLHNRPKKELLDSLHSIDQLLSPMRSTLKESISSCALLTLEQVKEDLAALEWQECPVGSIQTVKPVDEDLMDDDIQFICPSTPRSCFAASAKINRKMRSKSRKRKAIQTGDSACPLLGSC